MSIPIITEFYWRGMGRGKPITDKQRWTGAAPHTGLSITPDSESAIFIKHLIFTVDDTFALASDTIRISHWGNFNSTTYIDLADLREIIEYGTDWDEPHGLAGKQVHRVLYTFEPPIVLWASDSDTFEVTVTGTPQPAITGVVSVTALGWQILEEDAGFDEDWS